jgi:hypothetical protein
MRFYFFLFVILLNLIFQLNGVSQRLYKPGQIVTLHGDTLQGLLFCNAGRNGFVCKFRPVGSSQVTSYYPADLKSFRFTNGNYYIPQEIRWKDSTLRIFTEVLLEGNMRLSTTNKTGDTKYYITNSSGVIYGLPDLKRRANRSLYYHVALGPAITLENYKDTLAVLFKSSKRISQVVPYVEYNRKSLMNITEAYLKESCGENNCIRYRKDLRFSDARVGFFGSIPFSVIRFRSSGIHSRLVPGYAFGFFRSDPLSRYSDKLSLRLEALLRRTEFRQGSIDFPNDNFIADIRFWSLGVPVILHYRFLNRSVSPGISMGKEFSAVPASIVKYGNYRGQAIYLISLGGWLAEISLDSYKREKGNWFLSYRFQYFENGLHAERFIIFSNTFSCGIRF